MRQVQQFAQMLRHTGGQLNLFVIVQEWRHLARDVAAGLLELHRRIKDLDKAIETAFAVHPQATIILSIPGIGALSAAEFAVAVGDLSTFTSADHLASYAGLAPVPRDSG